MPARGAVKLSWFAISLVQTPAMSGCPSCSRGPAQRLPSAADAVVAAIAQVMRASDRGDEGFIR